MEYIVYTRIKLLCSKNNISISKLESILGFSNATIQKWKERSTPSLDKLQAIAGFFKVSTDYLIGKTDIESTADEILMDEYIKEFQRAKERMTPEERSRMMTALRASFNFAFNTDDDDD